MKRLSINEMKKKKKGFTLIELIIVIAIIAILAAIAIPKFGKSKQDANIAADIANAKNISLAVAKGIAEDKIELPTTGNEEYDLDAIGEGTAVDINTLIDGIDATTTAKAAGHTAHNFKVTIDKDANIIVKLGSDEVYPKGVGVYASSSTGSGSGSGSGS